MESSTKHLVVESSEFGVLVDRYREMLAAELVRVLESSFSIALTDSTTIKGVIDEVNGSSASVFLDLSEFCLDCRQGNLNAVDLSLVNVSHEGQSFLLRYEPGKDSESPRAWFEPKGDPHTLTTVNDLESNEPS